MEPILQLESARLVLRQWSDADLPEFARMCADPQVMRYFPATLSRLESAALIGRIRGHLPSTVLACGPCSARTAASSSASPAC